jgi:opacity protein-like surface antigen
MVVLSSVPTPVRAEWYADLYGGGAFTNNHNVTETSSLGGVATFKDLKFNTSGVVGVRAGYWLDALPWLGFGVDVFHFTPTIKNQTVAFSATGLGSGTASFDKTSIRVIGIGFDVLRLRLPLVTSEEYPHGRLQPYVTAGPAVFLTRIKDTDNFSPNNQSDTDTSLGVKAGAGVSFQLTQLIALFGEYRFTHFSAQANFTDTTPPPSQETLKTTFDTHQLVAGISF